MSKKMSGGCQCGAVRYETEAEPMFSVICHCRQCQRASGTTGNIFAAVPKPAVAVTGKVRYFETKGDSGKTVRRGFCPTCGCRLFGLSEMVPDVMAIAVGSMDDSSGFKPQMHVYTASAQPWDHIHDGLPAFPGMPPMDGN